MLNEVLPFVSEAEARAHRYQTVAGLFHVRPEFAPGLAHALDQERQMRQRPVIVWSGAHRTLARFVKHYRIEYGS